MRGGHTEPQRGAGRATVLRQPEAVTPARPTAANPSDAPTPGASPALAEAARLVREAVRDKSYQLTPIGADAAGYLRAKRKRLTDSSYRDYECCLDKLARHFLDLRIEDFEPPAGTERIEEFLDALWAPERRARTTRTSRSSKTSSASRSCAAACTATRRC
jgi:hypothetical protein